MTPAMISGRLDVPPVDPRIPLSSHLQIKTHQLKARPQRSEVSIITLGCSKNMVDSENILTQLHANQIVAGHDLAAKKGGTVIVNTCGFIEAAKQESIDAILHYANLKVKGQIEKLYVTGCLSQRYKSDLEQEIPEVDAFFGTMELPALLARFDVDYRHELPWGAQNHDSNSLRLSKDL